MRRVSPLLLLLLGSFVGYIPVFAQTAVFPEIVQSQEIAEDGVPVLVKHLPGFPEEVKQGYKFSSDLGVIRSEVGDRAILKGVEFVPGTEAVTAVYPAGRLLIIEYPSPQVSVETDQIAANYLASSGDGSVAYRRIGNYNVYVFDVTEPEVAIALLDRVKYEKNIRWLGDDPFYQNRAERSFVVTTSDIFLSTGLVIVLGMGGSIIAGLGIGYIFFVLRSRRKADMSEFSDAGGMTRLNLDHLTPDIAPGKLLGE
jgi:hypothetical protein